MAKIKLTKTEKMIKENSFYVINCGNDFYIKSYNNEQIIDTAKISEAMRFTSIRNAHHYLNQLPIGNFAVQTITPTKKMLTKKQINNYLKLAGKNELPFDYHELDNFTTYIASNFNINSKNWLEWCKLHDNFGLDSSLVVAELLLDNGVTDFPSSKNLVEIIRANAHNYSENR